MATKKKAPAKKEAPKKVQALKVKAGISIGTREGILKAGDILTVETLKKYPHLEKHGEPIE